EMRFVRRLKEFCATNPVQFTAKPLFLLRNMSRGRGVGFFEAGNFYPDFILWRIAGNKQRITFIDPKGIRHLSWANEPKLDFHKTIQEVEKRIGDPDVSLRSFIVSVTPAAEMALHWGVTRGEMTQRNILFDEDPAYMQHLIQQSEP